MGKSEDTSEVSDNQKWDDIFLTLAAVCTSTPVFAMVLGGLRSKFHRKTPTNQAELVSLEVDMA